MRRLGDRGRERDLARDERTDEYRRRGELPEQREHAERDAACGERENERGDDVGRLFGPARQQLLGTGNEGEEQGDENRTRHEREADQDPEGTVSARHGHLAGQACGASRGARRRPCRARR